MKYFAITLAILMLLSCSKDPAPTTVIPPPSPTPSQAISTPTSTILPRLTRAEAGKVYLALVKAGTPAHTAYNKENDIYNKGEFYDVPAYLQDMRAAAKGLLQANIALMDSLRLTPWPTEAKSSVEALILQISAEQLPLTKLSKAKSLKAIDQAYETWPSAEEHEAAANLVRAHLGLPAII